MLCKHDSFGVGSANTMKSPHGAHQLVTHGACRIEALRSLLSFGIEPYGCRKASAARTTIWRRAPRVCVASMRVGSPTEKVGQWISAVPGDRKTDSWEAVSRFLDVYGKSGGQSVNF